VGASKRCNVMSRVRKVQKRKKRGKDDEAPSNGCRWRRDWHIYTMFRIFFPQPTEMSQLFQASQTHFWSSYALFWPFGASYSEVTELIEATSVSSVRCTSSSTAGSNPSCSTSAHQPNCSVGVKHIPTNDGFGHSGFCSMLL